MTYKVEFKRSAQKDLARLAKPIQRRIAAAIDSLNMIRGLMDISSSRPTKFSTGSGSDRIELFTRSLTID